MRVNRLRRLLGPVLVAASLSCRGSEPARTPQAEATATTTTTTSTTTTTTLPPPPPVWGAARWGMTPEELLAAFAGEAQGAEPPAAFQPPGAGPAPVVIAAHEADGARFRVLFGFQAGRLSRIQLSAPKAGEATCYDVETRTTGEHGEPASRRESTTSLQTKETVWTLPAQTITLVCADKPSLGFRTVTLDYSLTGGPSPTAETRR